VRLVFAEPLRRGGGVAEKQEFPFDDFCFFLFSGGRDEEFPFLMKKKMKFENGFLERKRNLSIQK